MYLRLRIWSFREETDSYVLQWLNARWMHSKEVKENPYSIDKIGLVWNFIWTLKVILTSMLNALVQSIKVSLQVQGNATVCVIWGHDG